MILKVGRVQPAREGAASPRICHLNHLFSLLLRQICKQPCGSGLMSAYLSTPICHDFFQNVWNKILEICCGHFGWNRTWFHVRTWLQYSYQLPFFFFSFLSWISNVGNHDSAPPSVPHLSVHGRGTVHVQRWRERASPRIEGVLSEVAAVLWLLWRLSTSATVWA